MDYPLFPDAAGNVVTKKATVRGLEIVLVEAGCHVADPAGRKLYGGHSFRVSGSRYWTLRGLEVFKLQIFARWGSNAILRYVADIPLVNITGDISGSSNSAPQSVHTLAPLLESHVREAQDQLAALRGELDLLRGQLHPTYAKNKQSGVWHNVLLAGLDTAPRFWKSVCGWQFGLLPHVLTSDAPGMPYRWCAKCLRLTARGSGEAGSDDTSGVGD